MIVYRTYICSKLVWLISPKVEFWLYQVVWLWEIEVCILCASLWTALQYRLLSLPISIWLLIVKAVTILTITKLSNSTFPPKFSSCDGMTWYHCYWLHIILCRQRCPQSKRQRRPKSKSSAKRHLQVIAGRHRSSLDQARPADAVLSFLLKKEADDRVLSSLTRFINHFSLYSLVTYKTFYLSSQ